MFRYFGIRERQPSHCRAHCRDFFQALSIDDVDLAAAELDHSLRLEGLEGSADHFAYGTKVVRQLLVGGFDHVGSPGQQSSQTMPHFIPGQVFDEFHEMGDALRKIQKDKALREKLVAYAKKTLLDSHDAKAVSSRLQKFLSAG